MENRKLLFKSNEWTIANIDKTWKVIDTIAKLKYKLDYFEPRFEIITYKHMLNIYSSNGLPNLYSHWSFGKSFLQHDEQYKAGYSNLAYEVVINTDPAVCYLMENNSMTLQAVVMAHAAVGHGSFFKNNYLFKNHTNPSTILSQLQEGKKFIEKCESDYGRYKVESLLNACHSLAYHGINKYSRSRKSAKKQKAKMKNREKYREESLDFLLEETIPEAQSRKQRWKKHTSIVNEENILYFIEENSPSLRTWEKKIVRIVRLISQYLYPQMLTKMMNEGWASFWHYILVNDLYDNDYISDASMMEFLNLHCNVIATQNKELNPYKLGFEIFKDIKRICQNPTEEDKTWFPELVNKKWNVAVHEAMENFKDESFILQYLSPKVIRDMKLYSLRVDEDDLYMTITEVHDDKGYETIRRQLSKRAELETLVPDVKVKKANLRGDRKLILFYKNLDDRALQPAQTETTLKHLKRLWRYPINLEIYDNENKLIMTVNENLELVEIGDGRYRKPK